MEFTQEIRQVLAELEVWTSYGSVSNWSPTGRGAFGSRLPTPIGEPMHLYWRRRFERAPEEQRDALIAEATEELEAWRHRPQVKFTPETETELAARVVGEGKGWTLEQIAMHCRCTSTFARKARLSAGVSVNTGEGVTTKISPDRSTEAKRLHGHGLRLRQIAMILNCDVATVHRDLKAA